MSLSNASGPKKTAGGLSKCLHSSSFSAQVTSALMSSIEKAAALPCVARKRAQSFTSSPVGMLTRMRKSHSLASTGSIHIWASSEGKSESSARTPFSSAAIADACGVLTVSFVPVIPIRETVPARCRR